MFYESLGHSRSLPLSMEAVLRPQQGTVTVLPGVLFADSFQVGFYLEQQLSICGS